MNEILTQLKPEKIVYYFGEILKIPRPSKKEEKIRAYLVQFGKEQNLETIVDNTGNVLIRKPATAGMENHKGVILQSHMDMVCEKNRDSKHNFDTDPIEVHIEDGWLKAKDTTLGADNGIGVAAELAVLSSNDLVHGPLECLFTVNEETGLTGAFGLSSDFLKGSILLNLDSEDDGQFFIGCAGGIDTIIQYPYHPEKVPAGLLSFKLTIKGLKGGHSGDDINKGLANANKLLDRFLFEYAPNLSLRLSSFDGGNLRNAIAREAEAIVCIPLSAQATLEQKVKEYEKIVAHEFHTTEANLSFTCQKEAMPNSVMPQQEQEAIVNALLACPHGVLRMSADIPNFVETSTNLAAVKTKKDHILITTNQRSSVESAKYGAAHRVAACFKMIGATVEHSDGYPGWNPNPNSPVLKIIMSTFKDLFHQDGVALAIHAGLECGLFSEKYPNLDIASFGPTMRGAHSPDEKLNIETVERFWKLTTEVLKRI
ncbi:MAG: aminoacyl-histidine dipeptidase [Bacteroidales bacterium]